LQHVERLKGPFETEKRVLEILSAIACSVPPLQWYSDTDQLLLIGWCGDETLDQLAHTCRPDQLKPVVRRTIAAFLKLESVFKSCEMELVLAVPPVRQFSQSDVDFDQACRRSQKILQWLVDPIPSSIVDPVWQSLVETLKGGPQSFGALDYHASNIVLDTNQFPYFIDFESVGWDWPERRLVQYLNAIGAGRKKGRFISLLNREVLEKLVDEQIRHRLDGHHLLFYLIVIDRILRATARPKSSLAQILTNQWGDLKTRYQQAVHCLRTVVLSDWPVTQKIRGWLA